MSVPTYGAQECKVYFVVESTYGVCPTNPAMLSISNEGPNESTDPGLIKVLGVGSRNLQAMYAGIRKVKLKTSHIPSPTSPIALLQYANVLSSLSVQVLYFKGVFSSPTNVISHLFTGCKIDTLSVQAKVDEVLKADVDLVGQSVTQGTVLISGATYGDYTGGIPFYDTPVQKNGSSLTDCTDWKFEIKNNLKPVPVIQSSGTSLLLKYLRERTQDLTGELTLEFESDWALTDLLNDTQFSLTFLLSGGHQAAFSNCMWNPFNPSTKINDLVSVKLGFTAQTVTIT